MAFNSGSYLQPDAFSSRVNDASWRSKSLADTFTALNADSPVNAVVQRSFQDDGSDVNAFSQGASMATTGMGWLNNMNSSLQNISASTAASGLQRSATAASRAQELAATEEIYKNTKEAMEDAESGGLFSSGLGLVAGIFCERRLKTDIAPIDATRAWATVRDLPLYSFHYRHNPGIPAYGPMVDEVRQVDPDLLIPMDEQARQLAIADGEPIYGVDIAKRAIYESAALQQALQRIEQLEARLAQLEGVSVQLTPRPRRVATPLAA